MSEQEQNVWLIEGSAQPKVVAAGHSHILSLLGGLHSSAELQQMPLAIQYSLNRELWPNIGEKYWRNLEQLSSGETVVICWNGNQHNAQFLLESDPPITVHQDIPKAEESQMATRFQGFGTSYRNCVVVKKSSFNRDSSS